MICDWGSADDLRRCMRTALVLAYPIGKRLGGLRDHDKGLQGIGILDADKSIRFCDKIWEQRSRAAGIDPNRRLAHFSLRRDCYNDKHGQRVAFYLEDPKEPGIVKAVPALDVIREVDGVVRPHGRVFQWSERTTSWGDIPVLEPAVDFGRLRPLLRDGHLDETDATALNEIGSIMSVFDEREMIAFGRSESPENVQSALSWELRHWHDWVTEALSALRAVVEMAPYEPEHVAKSLWQCWSFSRELLAKSGVMTGDPFLSDAVAYKRAFQKIDGRESCTKLGVYDHVMEIQLPPLAIWNDPRVCSYRHPAYLCWLFSSYLAGTVFQCDLLPRGKYHDRMGNQSRADVEQAFGLLISCLKLSRGDCPQEFSPDNLGVLALRRLPQATLVSPAGVWKDSGELPTFVEAAAHALDEIAAEYLNLLSAVS